MQSSKREFVLVAKQPEAKDVVSCFYKTADGSGYDFIAGQFVNVRPPSISGHGKSYTISSVPGEELVRLTVKRKGAVSSAIIDMPIGETVTFEGPYGVFYPEPGMDDIVMLAGGIGVTPFYSVIINRLDGGIKGDMTLIYSNKTRDDIAFFDDLNRIAEANANLKVVYCLTQENCVLPQIQEHCRIDESILKKYVAPAGDRRYFVCGSIGFVRDLWQALKRIGVAEDDIYTESFY